MGLSIARLAANGRGVSATRIAGVHFYPILVQNLESYPHGLGSDRLMTEKFLVQRLDHLNLTVHDFKQSARWYEQLFAFQIVEEEISDGVHWGVLRTGDTMLCFYQQPEFRHLDRFELADHKLHGMAHFSLRISNVEQWLKHATALDVEILYDGAVRWPHSTSWYIKDPTGYEIEVVYWDDDRVQF